MVLKTSTSSLADLMFSNARMWVALIIACFVSSLAIGESRALYYKVSTGQVFGPFAEEQVKSWHRDGYFQGEQVQVSEHPNQIFLPFEELMKENVGHTLNKLKSKSFLAKLGKKAGAAYKVQRSKLKTIASSLTQVSYVTNRKEKEANVFATEHIETESNHHSDWSETVETSSNQEQVQFHGPVVVDVHSSEASPPLTSETKSPADDISSSYASNRASDSEHDMLAQLKRDAAPTAQQDSTVDPSSDPQPIEQRRRRREDRGTMKYSVKSLAKGDCTLWDAEDIKSKSSTMDKLLQDFETPKSPSDDNHNDASSFIAKKLNRRQLMKQIQAVVLEILRFVAGLLMKLLPGPVQETVDLFGILLSNPGNHAVLGSLVVLGVASLLREMLYMMLLPSVCALLWVVTPTARSMPKAAVMDVTTFSSATAGDIVTTVFENLDDSSISDNAMHAPLSDLSSATLSVTPFQDFKKLFQTLKPEDVRSAVLASLQRLKNIRPPHMNDVINAWYQVQARVQSRLHQVASLEKEAVVVVLIVSSLVALQTVLIPLLNANLAHSEIVLRGESDEESNINDDDVEDELLPFSAQGAGVHANSVGTVIPAVSRLQQQRRAPAETLTNHVRSVSAIVSQLIVSGAALSVLYSSLSSSLPENLGSSLITPLAVSLTLCIVNLYLQPRGKLAEAKENSSPAPAPAPEDLPDYTSSADRLNYLCDLVANEHQWEECARWGLDTYILSLLAHEQNLLDANYRKTKTDEARSQNIARRRPRERLPLFGMCAAFAVLLLSVTSWAQLRAGGILSELHAHNFVIVQSVQDALRSRNGGRLLHPAVKMADMLSLLPFEKLQRIASAVVGWGRAVRREPSFVVHPTTQFVLSRTDIAHRALRTNVYNSAIIIAVVLVLPSLLQIHQTASLSAVRTHNTVSASQFASSGSTSSERDAQQAHIAQLLQRSQSLLSSPKYAMATEKVQKEEAASGWSTQGPDVTAGIALEHVTVTKNGEVLLKDVSLQLPAGSITVIVGPTENVSALLSLLWRSVRPSNGKNNMHFLQQHGGAISVQGRELKDWNKNALRGQITFLSAEEESWRIHAGALAGCLPGTTGEALRRALRAQAASGAYQIIAGLPMGPATIVRAQGTGTNADEGGSAEEVELTQDQLATLHLSRALCHLDKPFVLLTAPTENMSADQERLFFEYLRSQLRPDQVVVVTTTRRRTADRYGDRIVLLLDEHGECTAVALEKEESTEPSAAE